ncbi:MAG: hypothetical protein NC906_05875 [Candidatus Omnitrophica bacterium]|nr:hypothetical protein [Candidatus Omnitrophota bacterium]
MNSVNSDYIKGYLARYKKLEIFRQIKETIALLIGVFSLFFLIIVLLNIFFPFFGVYTGKCRYIVFSLFFAAIVRIFYIAHNWSNLTLDQLAIMIEKKLSFLNNLLINSVQLERKIGRYPVVFIELVKEKAVACLSGSTITDIVDKKLLKKLSVFAIIGIFFLLGCFIFAPQCAKNVFHRIFISESHDIVVEPGNCYVERGYPIVIKAKVLDERIPTIEIKNCARRIETMVRHGGVFIYTIPEVTDSFSYRILSDGRKTIWYRVNVVDRTLIKKMRITYRYPTYTGLKPITVEKDFSEISALLGTKVIVEFYFNNVVGDTAMIFSDGNVIYNRTRSKIKSFEFTLNGAGFYQIQYYDPSTKRILLTQRERIVPVFDQIPFCEFISPGRDIIAGPGTVIPVRLKISDDFGINLIKFKIHCGEGDISSDDKIFFQTNGNGKKEMTIDAFLKTPAHYSKIAYYAECTDFSPANNTGRSSVYFIYPPYNAPEGFLKKKSTEEEKKLQSQVEQAKKLLEKFIEEQKKVIEAAKKLGKTKNIADPSELQKNAEMEKKWADMFQKIVNDLNKLAQQTQGKFTLSEEFVEMISHLQAASDAITKGKPITIPIQESQMGLELAEELVSNIERWLAEAPDSIKWYHQEPSKPTLAPEAELPAELEDIIGELIEQLEDMTEEIEDITSSWMDSLDKGAGWMAMDGSISNMSAKGITGNLLPNQQEIGGRSGEGRTGRSYGEMVEKTAQGKGGRQTPARLTPDNIEPGEVQDTSGENQLGPTGGGKASGWGPAGLKGPVQDMSFRFAEIAEKQTKLIEKAEKLERELKILNIYNPQLEQSISAMKQFNIQLKEGRYNNLLTTNQMVISNLKQARQILTHQAIVKVENSEKLIKTKKELGSIWDEKIPAGYESIVKKYYENISRR